MKKIFIIIIFTSVYLHFYPQPELTRWYEKTKLSALSKLHSLSKVKFKAHLDKSYQLWMEDFHSFSPQERENLKDIMSTYHDIDIYYQAHCIESSEQTFFYRENHTRVCAKLSTIID